MSLDEQLIDAIDMWEPVLAFELINEGANPNIIHPEYQETVFTILAKSTYCSPERLDDMLLFGADPNVRDKDGNTIMHYYSFDGSAEKIHILMKYATRFQRNKKNETPYDLANGQETMEYFKQYFEKLEANTRIEGAPDVRKAQI